MSGKRRRSSSGTSVRSDVAILPHLDVIREILATPSSEEAANKGIRGRFNNLEYATGSILELVRERVTERKAIIHKSSQGLNTLFGCLKECVNNQVIHNILFVFMCLSEHHYKVKMVHQGAVDVLLESLQVYARSSHVNDTQLKLFLTLLLQLHSKDNKFAIKARLSNVLPVTTSLLKRSLKDTQSLPILLSIVRILATNSTNASSFGRYGCMNVFPQLLSLYGATDYALLKYIVKALIPLMKQKSNAKKRPANNCISELVKLVQRLHQVDSLNRHIQLRKSMILVLSIAASVESCIHSFYKADGLQVLYGIARELHEESRQNSLATATCNLIRKCLPSQPLPVASLTNPILFPLDNFKELEQRDQLTEYMDGKEEEEEELDYIERKEEELQIIRQNEDTDIHVQTAASDRGVPHSLADICSIHLQKNAYSEPPPLLQEQPCQYLSSPSYQPQMWFVDYDEVNEDMKHIQSDKFDPTRFEEFFPELSFFKSSLPRSTSLPTVSSISTCSSTGNIRTSLSLVSVDKPRTKSVECLCPHLSSPKLVASDYTDTIYEPLIFPDSPVSETQAQYKKSPSVDREIILMDTTRFIEPELLLNRTVYDMDSLLMHDDAEMTDIGSGSLVFDSRRESCNLRKAIQIKQYEYDLILNADINTDHYHQWFLFEVRNMKTKVPYRFNIINCEKINSQFNFGMQPILYSSTSKCWHRAGSQITYYRNNFHRTKCDPTSTKEGLALSKYYFTTTFTIVFPTAQDICYLAYHYPYTYSMLQADILSLERALQLNCRHIFYRHQSLCFTLSGHSCPLLTITNLPRGRKRMKEKESIVLSARVHPGESNASWVMKGVLEFLLSSQPEADKLRDIFVFKIIPMLNPDGVINGSHRCSLSGQDLNRQWITPDPLLHPTIYNTKGILQWLVHNGTSPYLFCDFHGHSRKKNIFIYGCRDPLKSHIEEELPVILNRIAPLFSIQNCSFVVEKSKEATARVAIWRRLGIKRSYTMESTYCGADQGVLQGQQINTQHLKDMGHWFCLGLHQLKEGGGGGVYKLEGDNLEEAVKVKQKGHKDDDESEYEEEEEEESETEYSGHDDDDNTSDTYL